MPRSPNSRHTFVLIHAAGFGAWSWQWVGAELRKRGHEVVAVDLPEGEPAGLSEYADVVVKAIRGRSHRVVVAHSFGAFTAPLVCARVPVDLLVLVAGMIPAPGEAPSEWWEASGHTRVKRRYAGADDRTVYYHDVPSEIVAEAMKRGDRAHPSKRAYSEPWPLRAWPKVPTRFLLCQKDRLFPAGWMRRLVRERLGIVADEIDSGHCPMLSRPAQLAQRLAAFPS